MYGASPVLFRFLTKNLTVIRYVWNLILGRNMYGILPDSKKGWLKILFALIAFFGVIAICSWFGDYTVKSTPNLDPRSTEGFILFAMASTAAAGGILAIFILRYFSYSQNKPHTAL